MITTPVWLVLGLGAAITIGSVLFFKQRRESQIDRPEGHTARVHTNEDVRDLFIAKVVENLDVVGVVGDPSNTIKPSTEVMPIDAWKAVA